MPRTSHRFVCLVGLACLTVGGFAGAGLTAARASGSEAIAAPAVDHSRYRKLDRFARALSLIEQYYVRPVDDEQLIDSALAGLVEDLDPHTAYYPPADAQLLREDIAGRFGGIGVTVNVDTEPYNSSKANDLSGANRDAQVGDESLRGGSEKIPREVTSEPARDDGDPPPSEATSGAELEDARLVLRILDVIPGGPAERAGVKVGDRLHSIEGKPISHYGDLNEAVIVMRGPPGTEVHFTIATGDAAARDLVLTRALVDPPAVELRWLGEGLGVLRLRDFQEASSKEVERGIDDLRAQAKQHGQTLDGLILDLRDNGGGLLDQAISIVDLFVASGPIVRSRGREGRAIEEFRARGPGTITDLPLILLINKGSASASEIVAGALQDHRRALIVGERSYGKGSIQAPYDIGGGAVLKLTIALYYTPDDRLIQASGIEPDVRVGPLMADYVDSRPNIRPEREAANHLEPEDFGGAPVPTDDQPSAAREAASEDAQLLTAIDHLQALIRVGPSVRRRRR